MNTVKSNLYTEHVHFYNETALYYLISRFFKHTLYFKCCIIIYTFYFILSTWAQSDMDKNLHKLYTSNVKTNLPY